MHSVGLVLSFADPPIVAADSFDEGNGYIGQLWLGIETEHTADRHARILQILLLDAGAHRDVVAASRRLLVVLLQQLLAEHQSLVGANGVKDGKNGKRSSSFAVLGDNLLAVEDDVSAKRLEEVRMLRRRGGDDLGESRETSKLNGAVKSRSKQAVSHNPSRSVANAGYHFHSLLTDTRASSEYDDGLVSTGLVSSFLPRQRAQHGGTFFVVETDDADHGGELNSRCLGVRNVVWSVRDEVGIKQALLLESAGVLVAELTLEVHSVALLEVFHSSTNAVDDTGSIRSHDCRERNGEDASEDLVVNGVDSSSGDLDGDLALAWHRVGSRLKATLGLGLLVDDGFVSERHGVLLFECRGSGKLDSKMRLGRSLLYVHSWPWPWNLLPSAPQVNRQQKCFVRANRQRPDVACGGFDAKAAAVQVAGGGHGFGRRG